MRIMSLVHRPQAPGRYTAEAMEKLLSRYASPGTQIDVVFPDEFPGSQVQRTLAREKRLNGLDHAIASAAMIQKMVWAAENGYDAVITGNTFDPAVDDGRLAVTIPVIGPLRSTLHVAANLADRIGILVPLASHVPYTWRLLNKMQMDRVVTDVRAFGFYDSDVGERVDEVRRLMCAAIESLVRDTGAQCVIPLGGALIPNVVEPAELEAATGVPVYNTKAISIRTAEMCVALGMTHSPLAYPPARVPAVDFTTSG